MHRLHHGTGWLRALLLPLALPIAGHAAAQQPEPARPDTVIRIEGVVVGSVRATTTTGGTSAIVLTPDSLIARPAPTMAEILREVPFVGVRENSRGEAEITVRGSDSRQVAVMMDGVPLSIGWDHRTDPSVIPLTGARSVTLVRGLHSVLYGPNVLGGVVEVGISDGPRRSDRPAPLQLRAGVDHLGGRSFSAAAGAALEPGGADLTIRAGGGYRGRAGVALPGGVIDPYAGDADRRANSDLEQADGFLAARYEAEAGSWLGLTATGYRAERGVPPELHAEDPRFWRYPSTTRAIAVLSAGSGHHETGVGVGDVEASLGLDLGSLQVASYEDGGYGRVIGREEGDDRTLTARLLGDHSLGRATLTGAATYVDVSHDELLDGAAAAEYRQRLWSVASEVAVPFAAGARLSGGVALDGADTPESGGREPLGALRSWGGRLGASVLAMGDRVRLHAAANRRSRFPSLRELYSGALGRFEPNPALRPETLVGIEAGATAQRGPLEIQAVGFHHRLSDAVVRTARPDGRFRRENQHRIESSGLELLADWRIGGGALLADAMLQRVRLVDPDGSEPDRRPENQPELRVGLDARVPLPLGLRGSLNADYTGTQHCVDPDRGGDATVEGGARLDAGVQRGWGLGGGLFRSLRATLTLDNAADRAVYDQCGLPQPGRTLRLAVELL